MASICALPKDILVGCLHLSTIDLNMLRSTCAYMRCNIPDYAAKYRGWKTVMGILLTASKHGDLEVIKLCNKKEYFIDIALGTAARYGHLHIIKWCIANRYCKLVK